MASIEESSSNDLSDASSITSMESQDTELTEQISNVSYKPKESNSPNYSPNDIRSNIHSPEEYYSEEFQSSTILEDPLPIVTEGEILEEEEYHEDPTYRQEMEFAKEMNTTKIAFAAYRSAVLHLVHHQDKKEGGKEDVKQEESSGQDANERMNALEVTAKKIVETKAKACYDAVKVAQEFMERSEERRGGRGDLLNEICNSSPTKTLQPSPKHSTEHCENRGFQDEKKEAEHIEAPRQKKSMGKKVSTASVSKPQQTFVKRKKSGRHPDCILSAQPKFQFRAPEVNEESLEDDEKPAQYRTTSWIGNMVHWRNQRKEYKQKTCGKCGCPDCQKDLQSLAVAA